MSDITQPYDRFFYAVFSNLEIVEDILAKNVPHVADVIIPGSLEDCKDKFYNATLVQYYTDIVLKAKRKNGLDAYIYILLKHKSYHEPYVLLHLLIYMIRIWEDVKKNESDKSKPLPFILPIVIYHGKHKWRSDTNFTSLLNIPKGMESYAPEFNFHL